MPTNSSMQKFDHLPIIYKNWITVCVAELLFTLGLGIADTLMIAGNLGHQFIQPAESNTI